MLLATAVQVAQLVPTISFLTDRITLISNVIANGGHIAGGNVALFDPIVGQTFTLSLRDLSVQDTADFLNAAKTILQTQLDNANSTLAVL